MPQNNVKAMAIVIWFEAWVEYSQTPFFLAMLMILDADPASYFLARYKAFESRGYIMTTLLGLTGGSEIIVRLGIWFLRYSLLLLWLYECIRASLIMLVILTNYINILIRFRNATILLISKYCDAVNIYKLISLYRIANIIILILQPAFNAAFLPGFCAGGGMLVGLAYFVIRQHNDMTMYTLPSSIFIILTFLIFLNQVFESLADVHYYNMVALQFLKSNKLVSRFESSNSKKEYKRTIKALKPWGIPLGIGNYTFFLAKHTNKADAIQELMDATITMLLTE